MYLYQENVEEIRFNNSNNLFIYEPNTQNW